MFLEGNSYPPSPSMEHSSKTRCGVYPRQNPSNVLKGRFYIYIYIYIEREREREREKLK